MVEAPADLLQSELVARVDVDARTVIVPNPPWPSWLLWDANVEGQRIATFQRIPGAGSNYAALLEAYPVLYRQSAGLAIVRRVLEKPPSVEEYLHGWNVSEDPEEEPDPTPAT